MIRMWQINFSCFVKLTEYEIIWNMYHLFNWSNLIKNSDKFFKLTLIKLIIDQDLMIIKFI